MDFDNPKEGPVIEVISLREKVYWPKYAAGIIAVILLFSGLYFVSESEGSTAVAFRAAMIKTFKGTSGGGQLVETVDVNKKNAKEVQTNTTNPVSIYISNKNKVSSADKSSAIPAEKTIPVIIINEIMYDLPGSDSKREWIEIRNIGETSFAISKLSLYENKTNHKIKLVQGLDELTSNGLAIIADDPGEFLKDNPSYQGNLFDSTFSLSNDGEVLALRVDDKEINQAVYSSKLGGNGDGNSLQLINNIWVISAPTLGR